MESSFSPVGFLLAVRHPAASSTFNKAPIWAMHSEAPHHSLDTIDTVLKLEVTIHSTSKL